jgi:hypothetical protein
MAGTEHDRRQPMTAMHRLKFSVALLTVLAAMIMKTHVKAGINRSVPTNHNETLVHDKAKPKGLKVKTHVRAGFGLRANGIEILA